MSTISAAYRAVWRWHFYAGILVLPILCLMALTGGLYLFKPEIEAALYRNLAFVPAGAQSVSPAEWVAAAEDGLQGPARSVRVPPGPEEAVQIAVSGQTGDRTAFVDPYTGEMLGSIEGEGAMGTVKRLHSLEIFGRPFNILVEIVAGWAIILVATGVFLWWPRRRDAAVAAPRLSPPAARPFWRDLHAVTGLYVGAIIVFLAITGMPWSAVWGDVFLSQMRASGLGRPAAPAASEWVHADGHDEPAAMGWTMEGVVLTAPPAPSVGLDGVVRAVDARGMPRPYVVSLPSSPEAAFTVSHEGQSAEAARAMYVSPSGEVVADYVWSDFGVGARAFEWGIAVHQGTQYGWMNRTLMLIGCIGVWILAISATVMWWKRRPKGSLGAPKAPPGPRARAAVLGIVLPLAILYPLTGLSLIAAIGLDRLAAFLRSRFSGARA